LGATKNGVHKHATRAKQDGLRPNQTKGILHSLLTSYVGTPVVYYANAIYIYGNGGVLITVLNVETQFDKDLYQYTDYPTFLIYKQNRYKYAKDRTKMNQEIAEGTEYYLNRIRELVAPCEISIRNIQGLPHKRYRIWIKYPILSDEIADKITEETGLEVAFVGETISDDEEVKALKQTMRRWITIKSAIFPKVKHIDNDKVIIWVDTMSDKIKIKDSLPPLFEKEFGRELWVEVKPEKH